ncbi:hypothetical protein ACFL5I_01120 [Planctomycetota bacterium]
MTKQLLLGFSEGIGDFKYDHGYIPENNEELIYKLISTGGRHAPYICRGKIGVWNLCYYWEKIGLLDPWNRSIEYVYKKNNKGGESFWLYSWGPNKRDEKGEGDDISTFNLQKVLITLANHHVDEARKDYDEYGSRFDSVMKEAQQLLLMGEKTGIEILVEELAFILNDSAKTEISKSYLENIIKLINQYVLKDFTGYDQKQVKLIIMWHQQNYDSIYWDRKQGYFVEDHEAKAAGIPTKEYRSKSGNPPQEDRKTHPWPKQDKPE